MPPPRSKTRNRLVVALGEAVGERRRGRLVDQALDLEPGERAGLARRLALDVVEVGRNGDHRLVDRLAEERLGVALRLCRTSADSSCGG